MAPALPGAHTGGRQAVPSSSEAAVFWGSSLTQRSHAASASTGGFDLPELRTSG